MARIVATVLALIIALAALPGLADQSDRRLDRLFEQLHSVAGPRAAQLVEAAIWDIWLEHAEPAVNALMDRGVAAMQRQDYPEALAAFDEMVALAPDFAEAWNKRATVHYLMDHPQESLDDIERTLALEPRHFGALSGRGLVYVSMEELALALESFEAALAVNPQMPGARANAEAIRRELKRREI